MKVTAKTKAAAKKLKGKVKTSAGRAVGNERLAAEGRRDQSAATVQHGVAKAAESVKHGAQAAKGAVKQAAGEAAGNRRVAAEGKAEKAAAKAAENLNE